MSFPLEPVSPSKSRSCDCHDKGPVPTSHHRDCPPTITITSSNISNHTSTTSIVPPNPEQDPSHHPTKPTPTPRSLLRAQRKARWKRLVRWTPPFIWFPALVFVLIFLSVWTAFGFNRSPEACQPDGQFSPVVGSYAWWSWDGVFQITMAFGELSFTQAKVVDIVWDLIIGRGVQAALAYCSWRAFSAYLAMSIDKTAQPLTYDAFWIIFLHQEASVRSIYRVGTDPTVYRAVRHKTAAIFALLSLIFVLVFPTLAGAMTGYVMKTDPYVKDAPGEDGNYIRFDEFDFVAYVVHDAWRIGKTGDWLIPQPAGSFPGYANLGRTTPIFAIENSKPTQMSSYDGSIDTQSLLATATHYVLEYGLHGTHNAPSVWPDAEAQVKLPAPALNITAYYLFSGNLQELQISDRLLPQNTSQIMYMQANRTYDLAYVNANGRCQSKADVYQWGFSYIQVFIMTLVLILWTLGTWLVWLQAHINLPPRNDEQTGDFLVPKETLQAPRGYNGVLQLAAAIQDDADSLGADPAELTPGEARAQMQAHARGARVFVSLQPKLSFYPSFTSNRSSRTKPGVSLAGYLWSRIKKIKWWAAVFFLYSTNVFSAIFYQLLFSTILFPVWPLIAISWLACFGAYSFLFLGGMRWLWLYVPCTGALIGVAWCYAIGGFKVMRF